MPDSSSRQPFKIKFVPNLIDESAINEQVEAAAGRLENPTASVCGYRAHYGVNFYLRAATGAHLWYSPLLVFRDSDHKVSVQVSDRRYAYPIPRDENVPRAYTPEQKRLIQDDPASRFVMQAEEIENSLKEVMADVLASSN